MAFNAGAFAGALGQSALSTYERLGEQGFRNLQRQQMVEDMQDKAALKEAIASASQEKNWTGGQDVSQAINQGTKVYDPETAKTVQGIIASQTPEQQQQTLRALGSAEGAVTSKMQEGALDLAKVGVYQGADGKTMATNQGEALSRADIYKGALRKAEETGNVYAIDKLTQMKTQARQSENEDKFFKRQEKFNNDLATIRGTLESFGMKGIFDLASKNGMKDIKFVEGKNGIGSRVQILGPKGDVLETISDPNVAADRLSEFVTSRFLKESASFLGSPKDVVAYMQGERKVRAAEMSAQADVEYKGKGGVIDRAYQTGARGGAGGGSGTTERILAKAEEMSKDKNSKFFGKKEQAYEFLKRGFNRDEDALAWDKIEVKLRSEPGVKPEEIAAQRADFFRTRGYAPPAAVQALRTGVNPATKKPLTEKELSDFNRTYPKTPWQDILGTDTPPLPPSSTQIGGIPVPR